MRGLSAKNCVLQTLFLNQLAVCHTRKGGALGAGSMLRMTILLQLQSLQIPIFHPFSLQISKYDFFFLTLGTGVTFSCCCMLRNVSLLQGERNP